MSKDMWRFIKKEYSKLPAEMVRILLVFGHLSSGAEVVWRGLMVWVVDNNRDMLVVSQM